MATQLHERSDPRRPGPSLGGFEKARRKFLRRFPGGFRDETYLAWERNYKWEAHQEWQVSLAKDNFQQLLRQHAYQSIAATAVKIESGRSLLFSFEKMALRDALRQPAGAKLFSQALFAFLHGKGTLEQRFADWVLALDSLPRKQTRVLS